VHQDSATPRLANIRLHPIKSLDPVFVREARIGPNGGLQLDRAWALFSADGRWVNGKRTPAMHLIRAAYAPDVSSVTLSVPGDRRNIPAMTFAFPGDMEGASEWFSMYFEQALTVRYAREGFPDDGLAPGPTIVSTSSLRAVCEWFPGMTLEEARRRFRTTLEIDGANTNWKNAPRLVVAQLAASVGPEVEGPKSEVKKESDNVGRASSLNFELSTLNPCTNSENVRETRDTDRGTRNGLPPFWEDQLFAENEASIVRFKIGEVAFEGSNPCARCPVPPRDSFTGAADLGFQKRFSEQRRANLPPWSPVERFDHFYRLATNTRVPSTEQGKLLRVGDELSVR
jgi:uncharacterized protein YcbX